MPRVFRRGFFPWRFALFLPGHAPSSRLVRERDALILREGFVGITVQPAFARLRGCNDRMAARIGMLGGVLIGRVVAAERHSAFLARTQMNPVAADLHAFFAFEAFRPFD